MSISMSASMAPSKVSMGCDAGSSSVGRGGGSVIVKDRDLRRHVMVGEM